MFGEWSYARHSVHYLGLSHYFYEFDIYDKEAGQFLALETRTTMMEETGIHTMPLVHCGALDEKQLRALIGESAFDSRFNNPTTVKIDQLMEGLYMRTEAPGFVTARAKIVRLEFVERVMQSEHWKHQQMVPNELLPGMDIWQ